MNLNSFKFHHFPYSWYLYNNGIENIKMLKCLSCQTEFLIPENNIVTDVVIMQRSHETGSVIVQQCSVSANSNTSKRSLHGIYSKHSKSQHLTYLKGKSFQFNLFASTQPAHCTNLTSTHMNTRHACVNVKPMFVFVHNNKPNKYATINNKAPKAVIYGVSHYFPPSKSAQLCDFITMDAKP